MWTPKLKKILLIVLVSIVLLVALVIIFISPITKYLVEKYDEKYTGRQITMDWAYVNPFTGYVHFDDLKIYEHKSDSIFISMNGISVRLSMRKLLSKEYQITSLTLDRPYAIVAQNKKVFNFDDLIEKFAPKDTTAKDTTGEPTHFSLEDVTINNGNFHYNEKLTPVNYSVKKFNFKSSGYYWDRDSIEAKFDFESGLGTGKMKGDFMINMEKLDYRLAAVMTKFDLKLIEQYMKDFSNYGSLRATIDADIKARGNFNDAQNVEAKGFLAINDFHLSKYKGEDYAAFKKLAINVIRLNPKEKKYSIDSIMLLKPYFKYEKYDSLDNISRMFGVNGSNVAAVNSDPEKFNLILEIAKYIKELSKNFFRSDFKINKLGIYEGNIKYNDFSLNEKFAIAVNPMSIIADSINKSKNRANLNFYTGIKPYGNFAIDLSMNPKSNEDFEMAYKLKKFPASVLNPYLISFTSFPLDRGTIEMYGKWNVKDGKIASDNHFQVIDPRVTKRIKNKNLKWLPMRLVFAFVRERGNVIDYQIPISGDLKDPKFHFKDVIFDIIKNIFVKPITTPYQFEVKNVEREVEKTLTLKWPLRQSWLVEKQQKFVEIISDFLKDNPEASIEIFPINYREKENEYILFYEAKKKYYLIANKKPLADYIEDDSTKVDKMSSKDAGFVNYVNRKVKDTMMFTIQQKCSALLGPEFINAKFARLKQDRQEAFLAVFKDEGTEARVKMNDGVNGIPFNGFSFYRIKYNGDIPNSLTKAYEELEELNEVNPRKKYKPIRKKSVPL